MLFVGEWDMRRAVLAGQSDKMRRFMVKCFEEVTTVLRNMQARGSNATRVNIILDLGSLNFQVQACPRCKSELLINSDHTQLIILGFKFYVCPIGGGFHILQI